MASEQLTFLNAIAQNECESIEQPEAWVGGVLGQCFQRFILHRMKELLPSIIQNDRLVILFIHRDSLPLSFPLTIKLLFFT